MNDSFGVIELPVIRPNLTDEAYYREHLVTGGPDFMELQVGDKAFLWREFEKHIGAIDPELLRLIREWRPTTSSLIKFLTSVGAYPRKEKIRALKEALTAPSRYSDENFMRITKILLGDVRRRPRIIDDFSPRPLTRCGFGASTRCIDIDDWLRPFSTENRVHYDPTDPDAEGVTRKGIGFEEERRKRWRKAWEDYLAYLKQRSGVPVPFEFLCDLPSGQYALITISPYLRLPSGDYLAPNGEIVKPPASSGGHVKPIAEDNKDEKKEEKKEEKKFPWWIVIVAAVVVLFFMMKNK
jgi:hypothetical protein